MTASLTGLSACIITLNEADRIERCITALSFCDEIIVVDAHSSDATREIAVRLGARVSERDWPGYRSQKQYATDLAQHEWVLSVDADEWVTPALRAEILALKSRGFPGVRGYSVPRLTTYFGGALRHGNSWPDRKIRLYRRSAARWVGYEVHEKIAVEGAVGRLRSPLEHAAYRSLDDHLARIDRYARLMAEEMHRAGRRCTLAAAFTHPCGRFVRGMLIKRGLLDGWRGWLFHCVEAGYVHRKYLRLWALSRVPPQSAP
ncbi:MAG TPA: glycosyltransferase family 2 protein [Steroidobacteraceae bacterium]|nr:glycosyltransferase family 2 protein [Steroidobacteraceae bacterium]